LTKYAWRTPIGLTDDKHVIMGKPVSFETIKLSEVKHLSS